MTCPGSCTIHHAGGPLGTSLTSPPGSCSVREACGGCSPSRDLHGPTGSLLQPPSCPDRSGLPTASALVTTQELCGPGVPRRRRRALSSQSLTDRGVWMSGIESNLLALQLKELILERRRTCQGPCSEGHSQDGVHAYSHSLHLSLSLSLSLSCSCSGSHSFSRKHLTQNV